MHRPKEGDRSGRRGDDGDGANQDTVVQPETTSELLIYEERYCGLHGDVEQTPNLPSAA